MNKQSSQVDLTNQSVFSQCKTGTSLALTAPPVYKSKEQTTVTSIKFNMRLGEIFSEFDDFDWSNVLLAGGLVSGLLETKYDKTMYTESDLDLFLYGKNQKEMKEAYIRTYEYFKKKFGTIYSFIYNNSMVVTILSPKFRRVIQLIGTEFSKPIDIIKNFDLTHCQVGFDGQNVIYTSEFIKSIQTRITKITKFSIHAYRLVKAYQRGYSIETPENDMYIKNYFHTYTYNQDEPNKPPKNTDKIWFVHNLQENIDELIANPIVQQNMKKNYIPRLDEDPETINKNITTSYSCEMKFIDGPLSKYLELGSAFTTIIK